MTFSERVQNAPEFNPQGVKVGDQVVNVFIDCNTTLHDGKHLDWAGRVVLPAPDDYDDSELEEYATRAFGIAQQNGLPAQLMALCAFYFYDDTDEHEGWVQFL